MTKSHVLFKSALDTFDDQCSNLPCAAVWVVMMFEIISTCNMNIPMITDTCAVNIAYNRKSDMKDIFFFFQKWKSVHFFGYKENRI